MDADPRRLIARLAVAVMVADGQITPSEYAALEHLEELGLGPMSDLAEDEIRGATHQPIDLRATCEGLAQATPEAAAVIMSVLAEIAASDRSVSRAELETLHTVAGLLGLNATEAAHILANAIDEYGATLSTEDGTHSDGPGPSGPVRVTVIRRRDAEMPAPGAPPSAPPELQQAYRVLGIDATASRSHLDAAYLGLVERYNPVKVAGLGAEFAALAVRKLVEATAAFETVLNAQLGTG
ncbi:MAG TPA: TerB family tellurite resistance protein [Candidatus Margulisiibacteriota bacterium]|nr:TerB family tellurite resistance protein [Candidatus Margulisiibacteriota bacterium]